MRVYRSLCDEEILECFYAVLELHMVTIGLENLTIDLGYLRGEVRIDSTTNPTHFVLLHFLNKPDSFLDIGNVVESSFRDVQTFGCHIDVHDVVVRLLE